MAKVTYVDDLTEARRVEGKARRSRCYSVYKNRPRDRWLEVCSAQNRRITRKARRSVGKSNKLGCRRTGHGMAAFLNEISFLAKICRPNCLAIGLRLET